MSGKSADSDRKTDIDSDREKKNRAAGPRGAFSIMSVGWIAAPTRAKSSS
jgi:hypothetical protein